MLLAWTWAGCSLPPYSCELSMIVAMNPGVPVLLFFVTYAGIPALLPCITLIVAQRFQFIRALILTLAGILNLLGTHAEVAYPDSVGCSIIPLLVVVAAWVVKFRNG